MRDEILERGQRLDGRRFDEIQRLAGLEPGQRLEDTSLIVRGCRARRRVRQLDGVAVGGAYAERNGFASVRLDGHAADATPCDPAQSRNVTYVSTGARSRGAGSRSGGPKCKRARTRSP